MTQTDVTKFDAWVMRKQAEEFSQAHFKQCLAEFVDQKWSEWQTNAVSKS